MAMFRYGTTLSRVDPMHPLILELNGAALVDDAPRNASTVRPLHRSAPETATNPGLPLSLRGVGKA
jgi:hypothetical protein